MLLAYAQVRSTGRGTGLGGHLRDCETSAADDQCRGQGQLRVLSPLWLIRDDDRCGGSATEPSSDPAATGLPWGTSYRVEVCADAETRSITTSTLPDALSAKAQFSVGHGEGA
jgi:hypothetical protein